jgi:hypothetical protein
MQSLTSREVGALHDVNGIEGKGQCCAYGVELPRIEEQRDFGSIRSSRAGVTSSAQPAIFERAHICPYGA